MTPRTDGDAAAELDRLAGARYVSVTTFRRDGTPVATPMWASAAAGTLYLWTRATSGKVKRLRHDSRVLLAPCDAHGVPQGPAVAGTATLLDAAGLARVVRLHRDKYGLRFTVTNALAVLPRPNRGGGQVAVAVTIDP